jgi:heme O synthase-like polyprenyltransferase
MLPRFDLDSRFTRGEILVFTFLLILATLLPVAEGRGAVYTSAMGLAGVFMLYHVGRLVRSTSKALASCVVHASVIYLPGVLGWMIAWKGKTF